jgi:carboxymethylenebutenolidase
VGVSGSDISIEGPDGRFTAYLARPDAGSAPGVLVVQEIYGVNSVMRGVCDWLAGNGYLALCPDLFWRLNPGVQLTDAQEDQRAQARALQQRFNVALGLADLDAAVDALRRTPGASGRVGCVGYCLGGVLAYLLAARSRIDCAVAYYPVGMERFLDDRPRTLRPLLVHVAADDPFVPAEVRRQIEETLHGFPDVTVHVYEGAGHAFARVGSHHHRPPAAEAANARTLAFLDQRLRSARRSKGGRQG